MDKQFLELLEELQAITNDISEISPTGEQVGMEFGKGGTIEFHQKHEKGAVNRLKKLKDDFTTYIHGSGTGND